MKPATDHTSEETDTLEEALDRLSEAASQLAAQRILLSYEEAQASKSSPTQREKASEPRGRKKTITVRLAVLLIGLSIAGTALALTQTTLSTEFLEIFNTQYAATDFSISSFVTKPQGNNKLTIDITLGNTDGVSAHFANVTVNLINATGDEFLNLTLPTGSVAAAGSVALSFVFNQVNVVANYQNSQIIIDQSS